MKLVPDTPAPDVPAEVLAAERVVSTWFAERGIRGWRLGGCADRNIVEGEKQTLAEFFGAPRAPVAPFHPQGPISVVDYALPWWDHLETWQDAADKENKWRGILDEATSRMEHGKIEEAIGMLWTLQNLPRHVVDRLNNRKMQDAIASRGKRVDC